MDEREASVTTRAYVRGQQQRVVPRGMPFGLRECLGKMIYQAQAAAS